MERGRESIMTNLTVTGNVKKETGQMLRSDSEQLFLASQLQRRVLLIGDRREHLYG